MAAVFSLQSKPRCETLKNINACYEKEFADVASAKERNFKFWRHPKWRIVTAGLSPAWQVYARVTRLWYLRNSDKKTLPSSGEALANLYQEWRSLLEEEFPDEAASICAPVSRPAYPRGSPKRAKKSGEKRKRKKRRHQDQQAHSPSPSAASNCSQAPTIDSTACSDDDGVSEYDEERTPSSSSMRLTLELGDDY